MHDEARTGERVAILLATYDGEKYPDEQTYSPFSQPYHDVVVLVREVHSSDGTPEVLECWSVRT